MWITDNLTPTRRGLAGAVRSIGASKQCVIDIPPGPTYLGLLIDCTISGTGATRAEIASMLTQWRLTISGTEIWTLTGQELMSITEFYLTGQIGDSGKVFIPFSRIWMRDLPAVLNPALGTKGETSVELTITQDATSTIDLITAETEIDPIAQPLGRHVRIKRWTPSIASTGRYEFTGLYKNPNAVLLALHIVVPVAANLTNITYVADGVRLFDEVTQARLAKLYSQAVKPRTIQTAAKIIGLDFCYRGIDSDAVRLSMVEQRLDLTFATAAPNNVSILAEIGTDEPTQAGLAAAAAR